MAISFQPDETPQETERKTMTDEQGAIGYIMMWLLGVPASLLFVIFLLRGCN
jgi:hypothetical protein